MAARKQTETELEMRQALRECASSDLLLPVRPHLLVVHAALDASAEGEGAVQSCLAITRTFMHDLWGCLYLNNNRLDVDYPPKTCVEKAYFSSYCAIRKWYNFQNVGSYGKSLCH